MSSLAYSLPLKKISLTLFIALLTQAMQVGRAQSIGAQPQDSTAFHIRSVSLLSKDMKRTALWYKTFLHFKLTTYSRGQYVKLHHEGFELHILQGKNVLLPSAVALPKGKTTINRIAKIGFACRDFGAIYEHLKKESQTIAQDLTIDLNLGMSYFIALDPDENQIQIFESDADASAQLQPMFFSITTSDYIHTAKWYKDYVHFAEISIEDDRKAHFQALLSKGGVVFEIIYLPYESAEITEFMPEGFELAGIAQITFQSEQGKTAAFETDNNANKIKWLR